ncbi:hypothetical protein [Salinispora vitiensis]|uniref:hypothetical protein n=1 Tax=Salinispora vitiensis TaxID=999544 RepID=UPI00037F7C22|nr:hypothetical protein [Salinispora vitiensis]
MGAVEVQAAGWPAWWQIVGPIIAALIGVATGLYGTRSSWRAAEASNDTARARLDHDRDAHVDARTDRQLEQTWARLTEVTAELDQRTAQFWALWEQHQRLRLAVMHLGHDPDAVIGATGNHGPRS